HRDVLADRRHDLLAQQRQQIRLAARGAPLVRQQDLEPVARDRRSPPSLDPAKPRHAALRPKSFSIRRFLSVGSVIGRFPPLTRRTASQSARAGALDGLQTVTGEPMFEARSTSSLSGTTPSSGMERISSTSSRLSISPRAARPAS